MDKTKNYQLNQWAAGDKVQRIDFNADNDKIDGAIAAVSARAGALETGKADKADLDAARATIPKLAAGSYAGDGAASRTIRLGFAPKAVLVVCSDGTTKASGDVFGGLAVTGGPVTEEYNSQTVTALELVSNGFRVGKQNISYRRSATNDSGKTYHYIAFGDRKSVV